MGAKRYILLYMYTHEAWSMKARNINLQATQMTGMICTVRCNKFISARKSKSYATTFVTNENENGCGTSFFHIKGWYTIVAFDYCVSIKCLVQSCFECLRTKEWKEKKNRINRIKPFTRVIKYYLVKYYVSACQRNQFIFWAVKIDFGVFFPAINCEHFSFVLIDNNVLHEPILIIIIRRCCEYRVFV